MRARGSPGRVAGGVPVLLLTTTGRRSSRQRTTPLLFHREPSGSILLVAADVAADWNPHWLHNLLAQPHAETEIGGKRTPVAASVLNDAERAVAWNDARRAFPGLDAAQGETCRVIPLVRLTIR